jgi:hypothetical protein
MVSHIDLHAILDDGSTYGTLGHVHRTRVAHDSVLARLQCHRHRLIHTNLALITRTNIVLILLLPTSFSFFHNLNCACRSEEIEKNEPTFGLSDRLLVCLKQDIQLTLGKREQRWEVTLQAK